MALEVVLATRAGVEYGRVPDAGSIGTTRGIKAPRTGRFTLPEGNAMRTVVRMAPRTIAKIYDVDNDGGRVLKIIGPLTSYQRTTSEQGAVVSIGVTDAAWYLDHRVISTFNPMQASQERGHYLAWIVRRLQSQVPIPEAEYVVVDALGNTFDVTPLLHGYGVAGFGDSVIDTGIRPRTIADTAAIMLDSQPWQKASELFARVTQGLDTAEWAVYPSEPTADAYGVRIGHLDVAPVIGTIKPNVIFEEGDGKRNVTSHENLIDPNTQANSILADTPTGHSEDFDAAAIADTGVMLQDLVATSIPSVGPASDLVEQIIADHLAVRSYPRQIIKFTVAPDVDPGELDLTERTVPRPGVDYDFGDIVTFRATERVPVRSDDGTLVGYTDEVTVDALARVYSIDESDDDVGQRTTEVTVVAT